MGVGCFHLYTAARYVGIYIRLSLGRGARIDARTLKRHPEASAPKYMGILGVNFEKCDFPALFRSDVPLGRFAFLGLPFPFAACSSRSFVLRVIHVFSCPRKVYRRRSYF